MLLGAAAAHQAHAAGAQPQKNAARPQTESCNIELEQVNTVECCNIMLTEVCELMLDDVSTSTAVYPVHDDVSQSTCAVVGLPS